MPFNAKLPPRWRIDLFVHMHKPNSMMLDSNPKVPKPAKSYPQLRNYI